MQPTSFPLHVSGEMLTGDFEPSVDWLNYIKHFPYERKKADSSEAVYFMEKAFEIIHTFNHYKLWQIKTDTFTSPYCRWWKIGRRDGQVNSSTRISKSLCTSSAEVLIGKLQIVEETSHVSPRCASYARGAGGSWQL